MARNDAATWDRFSNIYDAFMKKDMPAYAEMIDRIKAWIEPDSRVLEIGTGTGILALGIAQSVESVDALDLSPDMIAVAQNKAQHMDVSNVHFSIADACVLSYDAKSYDVVIIANTLHVMPQPEKVLAQIKRVLADDGLLIAPTFVHAESRKASFLSRLMSLTGFRAYHKWTQSSFCRFLYENGFSIAKKTLLNASFPLVFAVAEKTKKAKDSIHNEPQIMGVYHDLFACIVAALEAKDAFTANHSIRVSYMTDRVCALLGLAKLQTEMISLAAHVHDIGKIGLPDALLSKPDPLSAVEWAKIRQHPIIGANILKQSPALYEIADIVLHHHERWDGKGYPNGIYGQNIPLGSRIIAVCDSIDAMTATRPYHKILRINQCKDEIRLGSGSMYDPDIAQFVLQHWDEIVTPFVSHT